MDRKLKRKIIRQLEKSGLTNAQAKRFLEIHEAPDLKGSLKEGDRVRLNLKSIQGNPDWDGLEPRYKKFVDENKDREFTVQRDPKNLNNELVMCLLEDDSDIKWRFFVGDLIKINVEDK